MNEIKLGKLISKGETVDVYKSEDGKDSDAAVDNIYEVLNSIQQMAEERRAEALAEGVESPEALTLEDWLQNVALMSDMDGKNEEDDDTPKVTLMTIHSSKGLEFGRVYIAGVEEEQFPGPKAELEGTMEEERRLFYVAVTRAKKAAEGASLLLVLFDASSPLDEEDKALLSFLDAGEERGFFCLGLQKSVEKLREREDLDDDAQFGIWSGGIRVSSNAGEQYLTGRDDVVDSETLIKASWLGSNWFRAFSAAMGRLEGLASLLYVAVNGYHSAMKVQDRRIAAEASGLFWQMVEPSEHELMAACDRKSEGWTEDTLPALLRRYRAMVLSVYDEFCPHDTARQFEAWVLNRPFSRRKDG